jgi:hypothetical protein
MHRNNSPSRHELALVCAIVFGLSGCRESGPEPIALSADERALVEVYVRITVLDAWRADAVDSVAPALDRLAQSYDSTAVHAALERLRREPERWEAVWEETARQLADLDKYPTPLIQLHKLDGKTIDEEATRARAATEQRPRPPSRPRVGRDSLNPG